MAVESNKSIQMGEKRRVIRPRRPSEYQNEIHAWDDDDDDCPLDVIRHRLTNLCAAIGTCESELIATFRTGLDHALRAGVLLLRVKRLVPHGEFTRWIEQNLPISARTARVYTRLAENEDRLAGLHLDGKRQGPAVLTIDAALKRLPRPQPRARIVRGRDEVAGSTPAAPTGSPQDASAGDNPGDAQPSGGTGRGMEPQAGSDDPEVAGRESEEDEAVIDVACKDESANQDVLDVESEPAGAGSEAQPSDEEWLQSLPIRSRLDDPTTFDEQALLWRRARPMIDSLARLHRPGPEEIARVRVAGWIRKRYAFLVTYITTVLPPDRWRLCHLCHGTGRSASLLKPCDGCWEAGFEVAFEGEPSDDREDSQDE